MKTLKQNFIHRKLNVIVSLLFAFVLLITCGITTRKARAEATFSAENFIMCEGAEVRADGINGIRFVASLGEVLPSEEDYANLTYNMMIVPKAYLAHYGITGDYYTALKAELEADETVVNKTIATMQTQPFYKEASADNEAGYYIRGTLSNIKYNNINVEWFGMAYLTYDVIDAETQTKKTEYLYANILEENSNVRSVVYCASAYLNIYEYLGENKETEKEILTDFVAQGINKAAGNVAEANKNDRTYLNAGISAIQENASKQANLLPEATESWTTGVPQGVKLQVLYGTEDNDYVSIDDNGVITGVLGDNNAQTAKNVTMRVLGTTYEKPVHVYTVKAELASSLEEIFTKNGVIGDTTFVDKATLEATAIVDGAEVQNVSWNTADSTVATVEDGVVTAVSKNAIFASEEVEISFSFNVGETAVTSNACAIKVSFPVAYKNAPIAYGDLMQNVFNADSTALVATTETVNTSVLGEDFGNVTNFLSTDLSKELLVDGKTDANVYGKNEAGEKKFVVVSENGYAYTVKATVVSYAISNVTELKYFRAKTYMANSTNSKKNDKTNPSYGMYVIVDSFIDYGGAVYSKPNGSRVDDNGYYWQGTFDGRGNVIDDLSIERGFFCKLGTYATVKNIALTNVTNNYNYQFGVIGNEVYGKIDNCFVQGVLTTIESGKTTATSKNRAGIFNAAYNNAKITNCIAVIEFQTQATNHYVIGRNLASSTVKVENCYGISASETSIAGSSTANGYTSADEFREKIASLPATYNSYWIYTESGLSFGDTQVLKFTQQN